MGHIRKKDSKRMKNESMTWLQPHAIIPPKWEEPPLPFFLS